MGIQIHLALLWTRLYRFETKPLDQRGTCPRKNITGVSNLHGRACATPSDKQGAAPAATAAASKHNLTDQMPGSTITLVTKSITRTPVGTSRASWSRPQVTKAPVARPRRASWSRAQA